MSVNHLCSGYSTKTSTVKSETFIRNFTAIIISTSGQPDAKAEVMELDLASLHSVREFAVSFQKRHLPLHILVLNAAVFGMPLTRTVDGIETHFGVNHLAHFHLANLLADNLRDSAPSRVVVLASESHW